MAPEPGKTAGDPVDPSGEAPSEEPAGPQIELVPEIGLARGEAQASQNPLPDSQNNVVHLASRRSGGYLPLIVVCLAVIASLGLLLVDFRLGVAFLAGSVGLAWLFRAVLPEKTAGLLVVRSRVFDLSILAVLALTLALLAVIVPAPPN